MTSNNSNNAPIMILGSTSFAGSKFIDFLLDKNYSVFGISRSKEDKILFQKDRYLFLNKKYYSYTLDINKDIQSIVRIIKKNKIEIIVDFLGQGMVAESWIHPEQWFQTNLLSKVKLINNIKDFNFLKKYIRISTPEVYGNKKNILNENAKPDPSTPYATSHASIDQVLKIYWNSMKFPYLIGRFANFYGPGQQLYRIIPRSIIYGLNGKKLKLDGGGKSIRSFIHYKDVNNGIYRMIKKGKLNQTYHFTNNEYVTIKKLVKLICQKLDLNYSNFVEESQERLAKDHIYKMSCEKSYNFLKWQSNYNLSEGIDETIFWIKKNINEINKRPLNYIHKI